MTRRRSHELPIPHAEEWQQTLAESDHNEAEQEALTEVGVALAEVLREPVRPRPGFQAELRARLLAEARRRVAADAAQAASPAETADAAAERGRGLGSYPRRRSGRSRRRRASPGASRLPRSLWGTAAAVAAALAVAVWTGNLPLGGGSPAGPEEMASGVAPGPATAGEGQDGGGADSGGAVGSGEAASPRVTVAPGPPEIDAPGLSTGAVRTAAAPLLPPPAAQDVALAVQAPAGVAGQEEPLQLSWEVAAAPALPDEVPLYALRTLPWSSDEVATVSRSVGGAGAAPLATAQPGEVISPDRLRRVRVRRDHTLVYENQLAWEGRPGLEAGEAQAEAAAGETAAEQTEAVLARAQAFLDEMNLDPPGTPAVYRDAGGDWVVTWTAALDAGFPLIRGVGEMRLTPELQVAYLELRQLRYVTESQVTLRPPVEAAADLQGTPTPGSGQVRLTGVELVYLPVPGPGGVERARPYYRFTGETAEGWPVVARVPAAAEPAEGQG